jgi:uncharacterized membrane protein
MNNKILLIIPYGMLVYLLYGFIFKTDRFIENQTTNVIGTIVMAVFCLLITLVVFKRKKK